MSDITKLTEKIIADADKRFDLQVSEAKKEVEHQESLKKRQLEKQSRERLTFFEKEKRGDMFLQISDVHIQARNRVLAAKQTVLDELFAEALVKLNELSQDRFDQFVQQGIQQADFSGKTELIIGEKSKHYVNEESVAKWLAAAPSQMALSLHAKFLPHQGGFLLRQQEIELNFMFGALLDAQKEDLSNELLNLIFEQ